MWQALLASIPAAISAGQSISNLFHHKNRNNGGYSNPADSGMNYLNQIPGAVKPYFQPYIDRGQKNANTLQGQYDQMTGDPSGFYNNLGKGYKESPGFQLRLQRALQGISNASAGNHQYGSPADQTQQAEQAALMSGEDYEKYLNHIMNIFGQGQKGMEHFNDQGFDASREYGNTIGNNLNSKAAFAYGGQAGQNQYNADRQAQNQANKPDYFGNIGNAFSSIMQIPGIQQWMSQQNQGKGV